MPAGAALDITLSPNTSRSESEGLTTFIVYLNHFLSLYLPHVLTR